MKTQETIMMSGKVVADRIKEEIIARVTVLRGKGIIPKLAILRVGCNIEDVAYEGRVLRNCTACNIEAEVFELPVTIATEELIRVIEGCNEDPAIHGILLFRPLPKAIDADRISRVVDPIKDVDCMNPENLGKLFFGDMSGIAPCTPEAVRELLLHYVGDLTGKNIVIVNRSLVLGKPLAMLLLQENATVTLCHSKTVNLSQLTREAEIVVTGVGRGGFFGRNSFGVHSVIADVGINEKAGGGICGDVDRDQVEGYVKGLMPVPGGVGAVTSMLLLRNVLSGLREKESETIS